jgi:uncharacterized small protein (DUF1192 family)
VHVESAVSCRKIAGLERLVLNADPAWRTAPAANALNRSIDVDELPSRAPSSAADSEPPSRRISAITQSMPVFNRAMLEQIQRGGVPAGAAAAPTSLAARAPNFDVVRPSRLNALHTAPHPSTDGRPATAAPEKGRAAVLNPRAPDSRTSALRDHLISPELRAKIPGFEAFQEPDSARADSSISLGKGDCTPRMGDCTPRMGDCTPRMGYATPRTTPRSTGLGLGGGAVPPLWTKTQAKPQALEYSKLSPRLMALAPPSERGETAVSELMSEVRNVRFGGQPGVESEQLRLARLEVQLATLQEQQADAQGSVSSASDEAATVQQDIQDLQDEISRLKAARQRKTDALTSLAHLRHNIKQLTKQLRDVRLPALLPACAHVCRGAPMAALCRRARTRCPRRRCRSWCGVRRCRSGWGTC